MMMITRVLECLSHSWGFTWKKRIIKKLQLTFAKSFSSSPHFFYIFLIYISTKKRSISIKNDLHTRQKNSVWENVAVNRYESFSSSFTFFLDFYIFFIVPFLHLSSFHLRTLSIQFCRLVNFSSRYTLFSYRSFAFGVSALDCVAFCI
jgi:hypothetical protein